MRQYKGYYIDKVTFNSKEDVDNFIKTQLIDRYKKLCVMFSENVRIELIPIMQGIEDKLHDDYGMTYTEIEQIELSIYK